MKFFISSERNIMKRKVLIVTPNNIAVGGIQKFLLNNIKQMDLSRVTLDIYFSKKNLNQDINNDFLNLGVNVYYADKIKQSYFADFINLSKLMIKNKYSVIHVNTGNLIFQVFALFIAQVYMIKKRIAHSHNAIVVTSCSKVKMKLYDFVRTLLNKVANIRLACSEAAGIWMFGNGRNFQVIKNGLLIDDFVFKENVRVELRNAYNIKSNSVVIGLVASFTNQKNHVFLINMYSLYHKINPNSFLFLIGDGVLKQELLNTIKCLGIQDSVIMTGVIHNSSIYYNLFDILVMPSLYEGLPFVGLEAQVSGLPCLFSNTITKEIKMSQYSDFLSLDEPCKIWVDKVVKLLNCASKESRELIGDSACKELKRQGYDLKFSAEILSRIYCSE